jgi:hypothetical protein
MVSRFLLVFVGLLAAPVLPAADPLAAPWKFDEIVLKNGGRFQGLLLEETDRGYRFQIVRRPPGRPTITLTDVFDRADVARVNPLSEKDRQLLREKLADLDPHGSGERKRMDDLELTPAEWLGRRKGASRYESEQFVLIAGTPDEVTRRAAVRLEQIYAAYARLLPPRVRAERPTQVLLAGDPADYRKLLAGAGAVLNQAVYLPAENKVVCGSDLNAQGRLLAANRVHVVQQLAAVDEYETRIKTLYKGSDADLKRFLAVAADQRKDLWAEARAQDADFDRANRRLFALLYHEAFHAYTMTYVYPPRKPDEVKAGKGTGELPRWLNEGLAQVFETAVLEAGELRIGAADRERLEKAQDFLRGKGGARLVPVGDLLRSGRDAFIAAHTDQQAAADRAYLTAWAVTHYLTFHLHRVGSKEFDAYLTAVNSGGDPVKAFEALVGKPVAAFEAEFHDYLGRLLSDGKLRPAEPR